jgi:hypothetical protein
MEHVGQLKDFTKNLEFLALQYKSKHLSTPATTSQSRRTRAKGQPALQLLDTTLSTYLVAR